jgi:hypothetical protein
MDPFAVIMLAVVGFALIALIAIGLWYPGNGAEQVDWKTARAHAEADAAAESEDLMQMLDAANARRRSRGEPELSLEQLIRDVEG